MRDTHEIRYANTHEIAHAIPARLHVQTPTVADRCERILRHRRRRARRRTFLLVTRICVDRAALCGKLRSLRDKRTRPSMIKKLTALAALVLSLLTQHTHAQG